MRYLILFLALGCSFGASSQTLTPAQKQVLLEQTRLDQTVLKAGIDQQSAMIDRDTVLKRLVDSTALYDINDPSKSVAIVTITSYWNQQTKKAVKFSVADSRGEEALFYFRDTMLIKSITRASKTSITETFYFSKEHNRITYAEAQRLAAQVPELSSFYRVLAEGLSFLGQR